MSRRRYPDDLAPVLRGKDRLVADFFFADFFFADFFFAAFFAI